MKKSNKVLSFVLAIVMIFSSLSVSLVASAAVDIKGLAADPDTSLIQGYVTNNGNANNYSASILLDLLDSILAEKNIKFTLVGSLGIDATSVDGLLKTIDALKNLRALYLIGYGSLSSDFVTSNWTTGQSRAKTGDYQVLLNLVKFISDNSVIVGQIVNGSFSCGIANGIIESVAGIDPSNIIGSLVDNEDGLYGVVKDFLVKLVYPDNENGTHHANYAATYKKTVDNIIYQDLIPVKVFAPDGILPGFKMDSKTTVSDTIDGLVAALFNKYWNENFAAVFAKLGEQLETNEFIKPVANVIDLSADVTVNVSSLTDFNKQLGEKIKALVPGYDTSKWLQGDADKIVRNIINVFVYVVTNANTSNATAEVKSAYDAYKATLSGNQTNAQEVMVIAKFLINALKYYNPDSFGAYADAVNKCGDNDVEKAVIEVIKFALAREEIFADVTINPASTTIETVLGDCIGYYLNKIAPLYTDANNTKRYTPGSGESIWNVLNYALNYYSVDLNYSNLLGVTLSKSDDFFTKLEKLQAVLFGSKKYVGAKEYINDRLVANLKAGNLEKLVEECVVAIAKDYENEETVGFVYTLLNNILKGFAGNSVFASESFTTFEALATNKALGETAKKLLTGFNNKKAALLPVILYIVTSLSDKCNFEVVITKNCAGKLEGDSIKVTFGGKTLVKGTDYKVTSATKSGTTTYTVSGLGDYAGQLSSSAFTVKVNNTHKYDSGKVTKKATVKATGVKTYTCTLCGATKPEKIAKLTIAKVTGLKISKTEAGAVTLTWSKASNASSYEVYKSADGKKWTKAGTTTKTTLKVSGLTANKKWQFKVRAANSGVYGSYSSVVKSGTIKPAKVSGLKASSASATSVKLSWTKVAGATKYEVYQSTDGKKWTKLSTPKSNSYTVSKLTAGKTYQYKVRAIAGSLTGAYSSVLKVGTIKQVTGLKISKTEGGAVTLKWSKATNASKYEVYKSTDGKKWTKAGTTDKTTLKVSGLTANKKWQFKVRGIKSNLYGSYSSVVKSSTIKPAKVSGLKASSVKTTSLKLSWTKVAGATKYEIYKSTDGKKWTKLTTTTKTSYTVSKLKTANKYQYKVRAISGKLTGAYSSVLKTGTQTKAPSSVKATSKKSKQVTVTWGKVTGASKYIVQYTTDKNFKKSVKKTTVTKTTATLTGLTGGKTYYVRVIAVNAYKVNSAYSKAASVSVKK